MDKLKPDPLFRIKIKVLALNGIKNFKISEQAFINKLENIKIKLKTI